MNQDFFYFLFFYSNLGKGEGIKLPTNRTTMEKAAKYKHKQVTVGNGNHL